MIRLRLFLCVFALLLIASTISFVSCTREKPTEPTPGMLGFAATIDTLPDRDSPGVAQEWYVQTSEQLDTLLDANYGVNIISGDTLRLKADTLFALGTKTYPRRYMSLTFIGDSPRPTISSTLNNGSDAILEFADNAGQTYRFEFCNIKLDRSTTNLNLPFIKLVNYGTTLIADVWGDLGGSNISISAVHDTLRDCEFRSSFRSLALDPFSASSDIVLDNVDLTIQYPWDNNHALRVGYLNKAASLSITGSQFEGPSTAYFMLGYAQNQSGGGATNISISVSDNDFLGLYDFYGDGPTDLTDSVTYNIDYTDNEVTIGVCPGYVENEDVTVVMDGYDWKWNEEPVDFDYLYYNIGQVTNVSHAKKYCNSKHWVVAAFSLSGDTASVFHEFMTPTVNYGSISGSLDSTAVACWDPSQEKWIAEMNVPATCGNKTCPVFWAATVTFCDSTGTSTEQTYRYPTTQPPCKDPLFCD